MRAMKTLTLSGKSSSRLGEKRARRHQKTEATRARRARLDALESYAKHLRKTYPEVFDPKRPKPLSMGVHRELAATRPENVSMKTMRLFLHRHTHSVAYLRELATQGAYRYGLEGNQMEPVSDDHRTSAKRALSGIRRPTNRARERG